MKPASIDIKSEGIRAALLAIYEAHDGRLAPAQVVSAARSPDSPLHGEFEWDDDVAAEQYRLAQAGALIRRVKLHIVKQDPSTKQIAIKTTRQFESRRSQRTKAAGYESISDIIADADKRQELIGDVLRQFRAYRRRYTDLVELEAIWSAIDEASETLLSDSNGASQRTTDQTAAPSA